VLVTVVEFLDEADQIRGVSEGVLRAIIVGPVAGRISTERENGADACFGVLVQDSLDLRGIVTGAGEVCTAGMDVSCRIRRTSR
jgi:hypothetical protein